jgi:hypothetical protein
MFDIFFYFRLIAAIGFLIAGIGFYIGEHGKIQKSKYNYLPSILFILGGFFQLISALAYALT